MTRKILVLTVGLLALSITLAACSSESTTNTNTPANTAASTTSSTPATETAKSPAEPDFNAPVKFLFADFPSIATTAKAGDYVLCPDPRRLAELSQAEVKNPSAVFYNHKMITPGSTESEIEGVRVKVPNSYLIAIPAGQKAKVGDVVLTWWQTGSGMQRAIVVDAANPSEPTVRYLDRTLDEDLKEKLKPDTFVKLTQPFQPGTSVAFKGQYRTEHAQVLSIGGDKVFVMGWGGALKMVNKADCTAVPVRPQVKAGDKVKAMAFGSFDDFTVVSVDEKLGKVVVKQEGKTEQKSIKFGDVMNP